MPVARRTLPARVLIVDDSVDVAMLLGELLSELGHEVLLAHDAEQALAQLATFQPDLGVIDIGLPVTDGYQLATLLREREPELVLIALTGWGEASDRERSREVGFAEHLVKPVSAQTLLDAVAKALA